MRKQKELDEKMKRLYNINKTLEAEVNFLRDSVSHYRLKCDELQDREFKNIGDIILLLNKNKVSDALDNLKQIYEEQKRELFANLDTDK